MFNNSIAYKIKNTNGTDPSVDQKLTLLKKLIQNCFNKSIIHSHVLPDQDDVDGPFCPRTFDGFTCWDNTPAAKLAFQFCPDFVVGFDSRRPVFKRCTANGTWEFHPDIEKPWTNYTSCVDIEDLSFRNVVNDVYVYGYSVSVMALLLSIAIFLFFRLPLKYKTRAKALHCTRIKIHLNLFTSFALNNMLWIIWYKKVVNNAQVLQENENWCQGIHLLTYYFMVTSYLWMFCEALHLHIALVVVFVKDVIPMSCFMFFGWGMSMAVIVAYALARYYKGETVRCWTEVSDYFWIITAPVCLSMFLSLRRKQSTTFVWSERRYPFTLRFGIVWASSLVVDYFKDSLISSNSFYHTNLAPDLRSFSFVFFLCVLVFLINVLRVLIMKLYPAPNYRVVIAVKKATRAALILIPLFGLHFILIPFRPAADSPNEKLYQVISALLTSLQGTCVAILFCFTNQDVHAAIRGYLTGGSMQNEGIPMTGITAGESVVHIREHVV